MALAAIMRVGMLALLCAGGVAAAAPAVSLFPAADVRLGAGPFLDAQRTDLHYMLAMDPDRLLAPFLREAGLVPRQPGYGNWESSGLDGHMAGHYLSALALMFAATGDVEVKRRLDYMVAELKRCQQANGDGYIGGIPGGVALWRDVGAGKLKADSFSINGKWVPWYNLHKVFAGLRDAYLVAGNEDARAVLVALSDWVIRVTAPLSTEQMQAMLRTEQGGMNEVLADVAAITGDKKYLELALRFSHQALLTPLSEQRDALTGLHANTQIPKVIGFQRIGEMTGRADLQRAAQFFWQTVVDKRSVAIGGNSVKEHFHGDGDFAPMVDEVEGPETCNTYNMLKLTEMLFLAAPAARYGDYYERALYNHILSSQRPDTGGFVYFTPMRPNHYRVYSQPEQAMWCCVGSGLESQAKYAEFIYAHDADTLYVNLFIASTLDWRAKHIRLTQSTRFPDEGSSRITLATPGRFTLKLRYPAWVAPGALTLRLNGQPLKTAAAQDGYIAIARSWRKRDVLDIALPMHAALEQMPDKSNYYALLHGPIVLAAKTHPIPGEQLNYLADDARMGHIARGPTCPQAAAPLLVGDTGAFLKRFKPVAGKPLTFTAPGLVDGGDGDATVFIPFFRLHDARYMVYWPTATSANLLRVRADMGTAEAGRIALDARTIDQVAPGEQQPESDHGFKGEASEAGVTGGRHWRQATGRFSYTLNDKQQQARALLLTFASADAGRSVDIEVNGQRIETITLAAGDQALITREVALPAALAASAGTRLTVSFVARAGAATAPLYGLRLLRAAAPPAPPAQSG